MTASPLLRLRRVVLAGLVLAALGAAPVRGQSPEDAVKAVLQQLFDGMRAGDSTAVRAVFHPEARMVTLATREGKPVLLMGDLERFVTAVGTPQDAVWDERVWDVEVRIDGPLATAWMQYAFYAGDRFSHCGVDAVDLFHGEAGWQIIHFADTRRREGCTEPGK